MAEYVAHAKLDRKATLAQALTLVVLTLFIEACGSPTPLPAVDEVLAGSRAAWEEVASYRAEAEQIIEAESTDRVSLSRRRQTSLAWAAPERVQISGKVIEGEDAGQIFEVISVGGRSVAREGRPDTPWEEVTGHPAFQVPVQTAVPDSGAGGVPEMDDAELVGEEVLDGVRVYHVRGTRLERVEPPEDAPGEVREGMPITVIKSSFDVYLRIDDLLPMRVVWKMEQEIQLPGQDQENQTVSRININTVTKYRDFNAPVVIELPEARR